MIHTFDDGIVVDDVSDPFLRPFIAIFIACCPFMAFGLFAVYMSRREAMAVPTHIGRTTAFTGPANR